MAKFKKAEKAKQKLRLALYGPSGAGKTYTALRIAKGLGGKVAVVDTEHGSASKYADRFEFDAADLGKKTIEEYVETLNAARGEYDVVIIDSLSHAWQELLEEIDRIKNNSRHKGNQWSAWSEGTPKQKELIEAILSFPGHVIATMRSATAWDQEKGNDGKMKPVRIGLKPEQGKGIEYEFDLLVEMSVDHVALVQKDRTGKFQDQTIDKPGEEFGRELAEWLSVGADAPTPPAPSPVAGKEAANGVIGYAREVDGASDLDALSALTEKRGAWVARLEPKWQAVARAVEDRAAAEVAGGTYTAPAEVRDGLAFVDKHVRAASKAAE